MRVFFPRFTLGFGSEYIFETEYFRITFVALKLRFRLEILFSFTTADIVEWIANVKQTEAFCYFRRFCFIQFIRFCFVKNHFPASDPLSR